MISKIIIFIGVLAVVQGTFFCPRHEIFSLSTICDKCLRLGAETSKICWTRFGCTCIRGYKRNIYGKCVPENQCCTGQNERYCKFGTTEKTCEDIISKTIIFPPAKYGGCCCIKGTVRNIDGDCIPECDCYPKCTGKNEVYKLNGYDSKCNLKGVDPVEIVLTSGCFCEDGYVRNDDDECTLQSMCPCGHNECYQISDGCEQNCEGINCLDCPGLAGCYCIDGHVRDQKNDMCVLPKNCKKHCSSCEENGNGE